MWTDLPLGGYVPQRNERLEKKENVLNKNSLRSASRRTSTERITNPQNCNDKSAHRKSANLQGKKQIRICIGLPLILFLPNKSKYILDYKMSKDILKFYWKQFKLVFVGRKILYLQKIIGFAISQILKSENIYGAQIANPQIAIFAEGSQI